jgi:hypothetical protein
VKCETSHSDFYKFWEDRCTQCAGPNDEAIRSCPHCSTGFRAGPGTGQLAWPDPTTLAPGLASYATASLAIEHLLADDYRKQGGTNNEVCGLKCHLGYFEAVAREFVTTSFDSETGTTTGEYVVKRECRVCGGSCAGCKGPGADECLECVPGESLRIVDPKARTGVCLPKSPSGSQTGKIYVSNRIDERREEGRVRTGTLADPVAQLEDAFAIALANAAFTE